MRIKTTCEAEFERQLKYMLGEFKDDFYTCPIERNEITEQVVRALAAREQFYQDMPLAKDLPLTEAECEDWMETCISEYDWLIGAYANSQRWGRWPPAHPRFHDFGCGMTYNIFSRVYPNETLRRIFPPKKLEGLSAGPFPRWQAP